MAGPGVGDQRPGLHAGRHRRRRAAGRTPWPTSPGSRWCSSSTRATTRRSAPSSSTATRDDIDDFTGVGAQVLAISPQSVDSHGGSPASRAGSRSRCWPTTDKAVGQAYGVARPGRLLPSLGVRHRRRRHHRVRPPRRRRPELPLRRRAGGGGQAGPGIAAGGSDAVGDAEEAGAADTARMPRRRPKMASTQAMAPRYRPADPAPNSDAGRLAVGDHDQRQGHQARRLLGGGGALHPGRQPQHERQGERQERRDDPQHQDPPLGGGEEPAADLGADDEVDDQRVDPEADERGERSPGRGWRSACRGRSRGRGRGSGRGTRRCRARARRRWSTAPTAVEMVSGTTTATGASRYTAMA